MCKVLNNSFKNIHFIFHELKFKEAAPKLVSLKQTRFTHNDKHLISWLWF